MNIAHIKSRLAMYGRALKKGIKPCLLHLIWNISPRFFKKKFKYQGQIFSIGIYSGNQPFSIGSTFEISNPVLTAADIKDIPAAFVADPFLIIRGGKWYMFFEVYNQIKGRGEIGLATSCDGAKWTYERIVLKSPVHLSYPHVFQWNDQFYMIPESSHKSVDLYKALKFPYQWKLLKTIIDTKGLVDITPFFNDESWWLFTSKDVNGLADRALRLYYADAPDRIWKEHPQSPIQLDRTNLIRCAGRVIHYNGKLIRFAQNCLPEYGTDVRAFEITKLTREEYQEKEMNINPIIFGSDQGWNRNGMHHIDVHCIEDGFWVASVDGWYSNR